MGLVTSSPHQSIWIGFEPRQQLAYDVASWSIRRHNRHIPIRGLYLRLLIEKGFYRRPIEIRNGRRGERQMWDTLSDAPMATEFAVSRFLVPHLARYGWALYLDCDVMLRRNVSHLFELADDRYAVMCVQHDHRPQATSKMDGQIQTSYARKNWSSVMLFNVEHPGNARLTVEMINRLPGRDLHRFCWLRDDEIGALPPEWNFLAGNGQAMANPALVHFTNGLPDVPGCEAQPFADDWRALVPHAVGAQW